jgi:hypothetical protein
MKNLFYAMVGISLLMPQSLWAHCDGLDGPVVKAAQVAVDSEDLNPVLIWVQKSDEGQIKEAFQKTLAVRNLSPAAKSLADKYFYETLVRVHRAGEGAPYTGLKPAERDLGPAIPAADKALTSGNMKELAKLLESVVHSGLEARFKELSAKKKFKKEDITAGREFVQAYVEFIHYVERLYEAANEPANGHYPEAEETARVNNPVRSK